jgi:hypothetical protein
MKKPLKPQKPKIKKPEKTTITRFNLLESVRETSEESSRSYLISKQFEDYDEGKWSALLDGEVDLGLLFKACADRGLGLAKAKLFCTGYGDWEIIITHELSEKEFAQNMAEYNRVAKAHSLAKKQYAVDKAIFDVEVAKEKLRQEETNE